MGRKPEIIEWEKIAPGTYMLNIPRGFLVLHQSTKWDAMKDSEDIISESMVFIPKGEK